jgi:hypothetical protein
VLIIDGGSCSFGIESTVLKVTKEDKYNLLILRKGGVSFENLRETVRELGLLERVELTQVTKKHFKAEDEQLEAPG